MNRMRRRIVAGAIIFALALGMVPTIEEVVAAKKPTKIILSKKTVTLTKGQSITVKVKSVTPKTARKKVTFASSNKEIATVSASGKITAVKVGTCIVKATSTVNKKVSASIKVTVDHPVAMNVVLSKGFHSVYVGTSFTLTAVVTPVGAELAGSKWSSSNEAVASVSTTGLVKALKAGMEMIKYTANNGKCGTCVVTVRNKVLVTPAPSPTLVPIKPLIRVETIDSKAIAKNMNGQDPKREVYVYLPPSYETSQTRYPVVYFLHGYGDDARAFLLDNRTRLNDLFQEGEKEFILVALDGNSDVGGSFYANSPSSGNWEDFVVDEVVNTIDQKYRTLAKKEARGLAGYSMGGFGALNLSLKHPDIYQSVMVFGPGVFAEEDLNLVLESWRGSEEVMQSYAQAFSPNGAAPDLGNIISAKDIELKNQVYNDWLSGFSSWDKKVSAYLNTQSSLHSISIHYSERDEYSWIPNGCRNLGSILKKNNIAYSLSTYSGGHVVPAESMQKYFCPFFGDELVFE